MPAKAQSEPALAADGAGARVLSVIVRREEMGVELAVQRVDHVGNPQLLGFLDLGRKPVPELLQQRAPVDAPVGYRIELLFQVGG